jgi:phospholipid transport system substrate-binding protein
LSLYFYAPNPGKAPGRSFQNQHYPLVPPVLSGLVFPTLIHQDFDLTGICRFVLGPYWRVASPPEQHRLRNLFADRLVRFYGRQLAQNGGGNFVVSGSRPSAEGVIVTSRIIGSQGTPIIVDWRIGVTNGVYKIRDVAIDGVSMVFGPTVANRGACRARAGGSGMLLVTMRAEG